MNQHQSITSDFNSDEYEDCCVRGGLGFSCQCSESEPIETPFKADVLTGPVSKVNSQDKDSDQTQGMAVENESAEEHCGLCFGERAICICSPGKFLTPVEVALFRPVMQKALLDMANTVSSSKQPTLPDITKTLNTISTATTNAASLRLFVPPLDLSGLIPAPLSRVIQYLFLNPGADTKEISWACQIGNIPGFLRTTSVANCLRTLGLGISCDKVHAPNLFGEATTSGCWYLTYLDKPTSVISRLSRHRAGTIFSANSDD